MKIKPNEIHSFIVGKYYIFSGETDSNFDFDFEWNRLMKNWFDKKPRKCLEKNKDENGFIRYVFENIESLEEYSHSKLGWWYDISFHFFKEVVMNDFIQEEMDI